MENRCVFCGVEIPEGRQVCPNCESKYKRLTKKEGIGRFVNDDCITCKNHKDDISGCGFCGGEEMCNKWCCGVLYNRLAELEDKIENGTLIELPCKVGDTVYHLSSGKIDEEVVAKINYIITNSTISLHNSYICTIDYGKEDNFYRLSKLGKSVFLTKAEAEAKLRELKGEKGNDTNNNAGHK